jgi:hypothetical protein
MAQTVSYNDLFLIEKDIHHILKNSPALTLFMADKFNRFFNRNKMRINLLHERLGEIQRKYIVHDDNGLALRTGEKNEDGMHEWIFRGSYQDAKGNMILGEEEVKKAYYKEAEEFLGRSFEVEI